VEGTIFTVQAFNPDKDERAAEFKRNYEAKFQSSPDIFAALAYDAVYIIADAIRNAGYDSEKIKDYLYNKESFKGVMGQFSFDKNGDILAPIMMKIAKHGKFVPYEHADGNEGNALAG